MPKSYNEDLLKQFTDFVRSKVGDSFDPTIGDRIIPTLNLAIPPKFVEHHGILVTNAPLDISPPEGKAWQLILGNVSLVTDANAANRRVNVRILNSLGNLLFRRAAGDVQVASVTENYFMMQGDGREFEVRATVHHLPIPRDIIIQGAQILRFDVSALQVGDTLEGNFVFREYEI